MLKFLTSVALGCVQLPIGHEPAGKPRLLSLKPARLVDATLVPLALRYPIRGDKLPDVAGAVISVAVEPDRLQMDLDGDGRFETRVSSKRSMVVDVPVPDAAPRPLLVARDGLGWWAAPAATLEGKLQRRNIVLLDADGDGDYTGERDWMSFSEGALHRIEPSMRMLADDEFLGSYSVSKLAKGWELELQPLGPGEHFNDLQWRALLVANEFRTSSGLPPTRLDVVHSDGCMKHALYLKMNNFDYSKPWDGVGSHDELPGNPGYTEEGRRAAKEFSTAGTADPARAIDWQSRTMLHRASYLGSATGGLGVGAVAAGVDGQGGHSVMGGPGADPRFVEEIVVVPAPGQRRVPTYIVAELPLVEDDPDFYKRARGYPVSVTWGTLQVVDASLTLFDARGNEVPGRCFTPEAPIHSTRPRNADSAFFVSDEPLDSNTSYEVEFTAKHCGETIRWRWVFST